MSNLNVSTYRTVKTFIGLTFCGVGFTGFGATVLYQSHFLEVCRQRKQLYDKDKQPMKMDTKTAQLCIKTLKEVKVPNSRKKQSKFFLVNGTEPFSGGSYGMRSGAIIGVPYSFTFESVKDVDKSTIRIPSKKEIDWNSKYGSRILESMVLSENAKKFLIAKEVYNSDTAYLYWKAANFFFHSCLPVLIFEVANKVKNFKSASLATQLGIYVFSIPFAAMQYLLAEDMLYMYYDEKAEEKAVSINDNYFNGAIEYYTKKVTANKAWRKLLGEEVANTFTENGDDLSTRRVSYSQRVKKLQNLKKTTEEKN